MRPYDEVRPRSQPVTTPRKSTILHLGRQREMLKSCSRPENTGSRPFAVLYYHRSGGGASLGRSERPSTKRLSSSRSHRSLRPSRCGSGSLPDRQCFWNVRALIPRYAAADTADSSRGGCSTTISIASRWRVAERLTCIRRSLVDSSAISPAINKFTPFWGGGKRLPTLPPLGRIERWQKAFTTRGTSRSSRHSGPRGSMGS